MKITLRELRRYIRHTLLEFGEPTAASGVDPSDAKGFYPYELERGVDIHSFWYKSPGRAAGGDGDPGRPASAAAYIGMVPKKEESAEETAPASAEKVVSTMTISPPKIGGSAAQKK